MKARIPNGGGGMSQAAMMTKIQQMQEDAARVQAEIEATEFTGKAGGGAVEITVTGEHKVTSVKIKPEAIDPEDPEMLEDFITVALNEAISTAMKTMEDELGKVTGNINIPGMPGMGM